MTGKYYSDPRPATKDEFKTLEKLADMIQYAYPVLAQFPRSEKFVLAADIKHIMLNAFKLCIEVGKKKSKKTSLFNLDVEIEALKRYIRLAYDLKFLSMHHYAVQRSFYCGGNWNNGANAGVFYCNGNNDRTNTNDNLGFRSALPRTSEVISSRAYIQNEG